MSVILDYNRNKTNYAELGRQYHCDLRTVKNITEAGKENELEKIKVRKMRKRVSKYMTISRSI